MSEQLKEATTAFSAPRVGSYWEGQGGIYVGVMPGIDGDRDYPLIASIDEGADLEWGPYGKRIEGADSKQDGLTNTRALIHSGKAHPAAKWAASYVKDGHSDFYLPAQRELNLCYAAVAEKFSPNWYWSSTQYSAYGAWYQGFGDGYTHYATKHDTGRARAVRRLFI